MSSLIQEYLLLGILPMVLVILMWIRTGVVQRAWEQQPYNTQLRAKANEWQLVTAMMSIGAIGLFVVSTMALVLPK